jgi:hypothetical protein
LSGRSQANSQHLKYLQHSLLDINSELIDDELNLQQIPAQQMNEYVKNSDNIYLTLQQYDPELAEAILQSSVVSPGPHNTTPERQTHDAISTSSVPFMYEVSAQSSSQQTCSSQVVSARPRDKSVKTSLQAASQKGPHQVHHSQMMTPPRHHHRPLLQSDPMNMIIPPCHPKVTSKSPSINLKAALKAIMQLAVPVAVPVSVQTASIQPSTLNSEGQGSRVKIIPNKNHEKARRRRKIPSPRKTSQKST